MAESFTAWVAAEIASEPYWFQKIELQPGLVTPGWSDPTTQKLPFFGLPERMDGLRVLDIGCSEGFFSFEAERRGAKEVVAIDSAPESIRRFNICRAARGSKVNAYLTTVYDLSPRVHGTFDLVMFFGVLYHLRHPLLAMEKVLAVTAGRVLLQSASFENEQVGTAPMAQFHPRGLMSGTPEKPLYDGTVFWVPNAACIGAMMEHVGFCDVEMVSQKAGAVFRARSPSPADGRPPDQSKAPGS